MIIHITSKEDHLTICQNKIFHHYFIPIFYPMNMSEWTAQCFCLFRNWMKPCQLAAQVCLIPADPHSEHLPILLHWTASELQRRICFQVLSWVSRGQNRIVWSTEVYQRSGMKTREWGRWLKKRRGLMMMSRMNSGQVRIIDVSILL